ncbi:hypothetical protein RFF05_09890 [Bengtsoniella intestinalis]|uniref:hypothetical protein n=1 Tax=Bengtsoniella intestinalis TaxID=3073143 RepID=UPI00391FC45D
MKSAVRKRIYPVWYAIKRYSNLSVLKVKLFIPIRKFLTNILNVKPRSSTDYVPVARYLVSKRLVLAIIILAGVGCAYYISTVMPDDLFGSSTISRYRYDSWILKFYTGEVQILAEDGYVAYEGYVEDAYCTGTGSLYDSDGNLVYAGDFDQSAFNGTGVSYYPTGVVKHTGAYVNNLYHGEGQDYYATGILAYTGAYVDGLRTGEGVLNNYAGTQIYQGTFQSNYIVYQNLLGKSSQEVDGYYSGSATVYSSSSEYVVTMEEIDALYSLADGANSLNETWPVERILVLEDEIQIEGQIFTSINAITAYLGQPNYMGTAWVNLEESVAINTLYEAGRQDFGQVTMSGSSVFQEVYTIDGYDTAVEVYIYSYLRDGIGYTFYTPMAGQDSFVFYALELI